MTPGAMEGGGAVILLALHVPNLEGDENPDIVAAEIAELLNDERDMNSGPVPPADRVSVALLPTPQFLNAEAMRRLRLLAQPHVLIRSAHGHSEVVRWDAVTDA